MEINICMKRIKKIEKEGQEMLFGQKDSFRNGKNNIII